MTKEQEIIYEYCKKHLKEVNDLLENMPVKSQKYGCGSNVPNIEHSLEKIHREMHNGCYMAVFKAKESIEKIIKDL